MFRRSSIVATLFALALAAGGCGDDTTTPSPTPGSGANATPTWTLGPEPTPTPEPDPGPRTMKILEPVPLPEGLVLYLERGCYGCDGGASSIDRVYLGRDGALRWDTLFRSDGGMGGIFGGPVFAADGTMYITTCAAGYCGYLGEPSDDAQTALYRSEDGGISWQHVDTFAGPAAVLGVFDDTVILNRSVFDEDGSAEWRRRFLAYPSEEELAPPPGFDDGFVTPIQLDGRLLWHDLESSTIVERDGSLYHDLAAMAGVDPSTHRVHILGAADGLVLSVADTRVTSGPAVHYLMFHAGEASAPFVVEGNYAGFNLSDAFPHAERATGNLYIALQDLEAAFEQNGVDYLFVDETYSRDYQHSLPAMFDLWAATAQPLELFGQLVNADYAQNRNYIIRAVEGDFLRVATGDSDCLNVRVAPALDAAVAGCYANGVLLRDTGETEAGDGATWRSVQAPTGEEGWASAEYLEE